MTSSKANSLSIYEFELYRVAKTTIIPAESKIKITLQSDIWPS